MRAVFVILLAVTFANTHMAVATGSPRGDVGLLDGELSPVASGVSALVSPNDPLFPQQAYLDQMRVPEAWNASTGDLDAAVCVLDTGVRHTHEDLAGARWLGGRDIVNGDDDPMDDHGHGTLAAGLAAAAIGNGLGGAGVGNVGVYGVKVLTSSGSGTFASVVQGFEWCRDHTLARTVVIAPLGSSTDDPGMRQAVASVLASGRLVVASVGSSGGVVYPAAYPGVVAVSCTTGSRASCFGSSLTNVTVAAPGTGMVGPGATSDSAYVTSNGTSWAASQVGGVLALHWSHASTTSGADLVERLRASARDLGAPGLDDSFGCGEVDAKALFDAPLGASGCGALRPLPPAALTARTGDGAGEIALAWEPAPSDGGVALDGYRIYVASSCAATMALLVDVPASTLAYVHAGMGSGETRCYRATSHNALGESARSAAASATTLRPPSAPIRVDASPGEDLGEVRVEWRVTFGSPPPERFHVERAPWGGAFGRVATVNAPALAFTDEGLMPLRSYHYRVVAANAAGESALSLVTCTKPFPWVDLGGLHPAWGEASCAVP